MNKLSKCIFSVLLFVCLFCFGTLLADKETLSNDLIRLHIVANSDSAEDQSNKLAVRDAVVAYLQEKMTDVADVQEAKVYIQNELEMIENIANDTLQICGSGDIVSVCLKKEAFNIREYDTFSLPSGIYESLCIEIGSGEGKNWWCVVFPSLCLPATTEEFTDTAVSAGVEQGLTKTLSGEEGYEIRFYLLDCLGRLENLLFCF